MSWHCVRGGEQLSEDDLRAHLASALRLEHIGLLLGAGTSVAAGGQTIKQLWIDFIADANDAARVFVNEGFIDSEDVVSGNFIREDNPRVIPNVEQLLDNLEIALIDWERRKSTSRNLKKLRVAASSLTRSVLKAAILSDKYWDFGCAGNDLPHHAQLLQRIIGARQPGQQSPWCFTTNYDLGIEWAAESAGIHVNTGFIGIHQRLFSPQSFDIGLRNIQAQGEARFGCNDIYLVKLHGSLTWRELSDGDFRELSAPEAWPKIRRIIAGEGEPDRDIMVFPRAAKYLQTVGYLSGELFRRFSDFLAKPQTCLIINGFSFGDDHINRLIRSALLNPTFQLIIFLPEFEGLSGTSKLNPSVKRLINTKSPRITVIGGESAYFENAVGYLPDPMLYDLTEREMRERLREMQVGSDAE